MSADTRCLMAALGLACALCPAAAQPGSPIELQHQAIALTLDWPTRQARGSTTLTLRTRVPLHELALDAGHLAIDRVGLADGPALGFRYDGGDRDGGLQVTLDRRYATPRRGSRPRGAPWRSARRGPCSPRGPRR